jgi:hypothetical protein
LNTSIDSSTVSEWLRNYKSQIPEVIRWLPTAFFILSVAVITAYAISLVGEMVILLQLVLGLSITGIYYGRISKLSDKISRIKDTLRQFSKSLKMLEGSDFNSQLLSAAQDKIRNEGKPASKILAELSSEINSLDQRSNILFAPFADGFGLWELRYAYRIERWIEKFEHTVEDWFDVIDELHAYNSLANYAFNHPEYSYPDLNFGSAQVIRAKELGHPTLAYSQRIPNDFLLNRKQFVIITGANMAGKSTFLRTVGVAIVMSNVGLPVCAESMTYSPIKLISSMRTSDSLYKNESYFFSELRRLKYISEEIRRDEYLIILDEILKGTNSADKEEGSRKFLEKLVSSHSTGIIATHDLSLCELSDSYDTIDNYFFDARITGNNLSFDYKLKEGICQNMNASFLLQKMNIV